MYSATHEGDMSSPSTSTQPCRRFSLEEIQSATNNFDGDMSSPSTSTQPCRRFSLEASTSTQPCRRFSLEEIQSATNNFDGELVIGEGGFGKVYKGRITIEERSHFVAIKRCDYRSEQGESEFRAEIEMLSKRRHCHLVSLYGFCDVEKEMILVYEYMPNGTLYYHLHKAATPLTWVQRLKIGIGAASGLEYLHTGFGTHQRVIHRDVKSSNILLDENWEAMISDFGLSKIGPTNQSLSYIEASVKGTFGYLDPEFFYTRKLTRKSESDVYSFGVVLLELLSGRRAVDTKYGEEECSLVRWAQKCVKERKVDQMVDSSMIGISPKCVRQFVQIAYPCLSSVPKKRPTMTEVVASLQALLKEHVKLLEISAVSSSTTGLTSMVHKYFGLSLKLISPKLNTDKRPTMTEVVASLQVLLKLQGKLEISAVSSSTTGLTSMMHKCFGLSPKLVSPKLNSPKLNSPKPNSRKPIIGSLQYWNVATSRFGRYLTVIGQPFISTGNFQALVNYRKACVQNSYLLVGPNQHDDLYSFASEAAHAGVAKQRTSRHKYQCMGQLAVPVYDQEVLVGVIELLTLEAKNNYVNEFDQIKGLLQEANLATKPM